VNRILTCDFFFFSSLDPRHEHDDTDIWSVLETSHLKDKVSAMEGKLDARIHEGGSNLSVGEKALISLARALLAPSNILVMDEATGSLDTQTDAQIQESIRQLDSTIITIAHRINTIIDYERIVVLDHGEIKEVGHPYELLMNKDGLFYGMCKSTNELDHLTKQAKEAYIRSGGTVE
jgi:ATP-binding cassette subfamily C (CFTR/MRP) protein 1